MECEIDVCCVFPRYFFRAILLLIFWKQSPLNRTWSTSCHTRTIRLQSDPDITFAPCPLLLCRAWESLLICTGWISGTNNTYANSKYLCCVHHVSHRGWGAAEAAGWHTCRCPVHHEEQAKRAGEGFDRSLIQLGHLPAVTGARIAVLWIMNFKWKSVCNLAPRWDGSIRRLTFLGPSHNISGKGSSMLS